MDPDLSSVYWLGGTNSGGKSSVARILGDRFGLAVYHYDDHFLDHVSRVRQSESPVMYQFNKDQHGQEPGALLDRPFEELIRLFPLFRRERFAEAIKDLRETSDRPLIAEGVVFRPGFLVEVGDIRKAVCLIPTEDFARAVYSKRDDAAHERTRQRLNTPKRMDMSIRLAKWDRDTLVDEAREVGVRTIVNDGNRDVEALATQVEEHWGLR